MVVALFNPFEFQEVLEVEGSRAEGQENGRTSRELTARAEVERFYREEHRRLIAIVTHRIGDYHVAEEAVQEAFAAALESWSRDGRPRNPSAWLISTARNKAIDAVRRAGRYEEIRSRLGPLLKPSVVPAPTEIGIRDERLRLLFICCHPLLSLDAQVALALRTLCGLSTHEIARAFLIARPTLAQRLVRARRKIAEAGLLYEELPPERLPERVDAVMAVIHLIFRAGGSAGQGDALMRTDLSQEAICFGRLLAEQLPGSAEVRGLLALMLLQDARRNHLQIEEGLALAAGALSVQPAGAYALQAANAAEHTRATHHIRARIERRDFRRRLAQVERPVWA